MKVKMNIRRRLLILVLSCSIISLLVLSAIVIYGMIDIRQDAKNTGEEIGIAAVENSSKILEQQSRATLEKIAKERADQIYLSFRGIRNGIRMMSSEMTNILTRPENYSERIVNEPIMGNSGRVVPQLMYSASVADRSTLQREIGLSGNIQDFLVQLNEASDLIASTYVASKNGFIIQADSISDRKFDEFGNVAPYEAFARPWYQKASAENKMIFTDVVNDIHGGGLCIICAAPYYQDGEFAGVAGMGAYLREVNEIVLDTKVGETGFGFVINSAGHVLFSPKTEGELAADAEGTKDLRLSQESTLAEAAKHMIAGEAASMPVQIAGVDYYIAYAPLKDTDWSFAALIQADEVAAPAVSAGEAIIGKTNDLTSAMDSQIFRITIATIIAAIILLIVVSVSGFKLANRFVKPIHELADGVREIASGDLDKKLDIKTGDEIEHLSVCFNAMTDELKTYMNNLTKITAEKERIATELDVAKNIQTSMLPNDFPPFPDKKEFDIYATMNAAKEVGGDFYDFYLLDENHLVVTIADVSGKGIPAALFMMISKTVLKNFSMTMTNPDDFAAVMALSNNQLCQNNDAMMFVTVFMGMLDIKTGEFVFVNGGHNPPLVYHKATDSYEYLKVAKNFVLGGMEDIDFKQQSIKLEKGDIIFMYTDGVTEALNPNNELYGEERLINCLNRSDKNLPVEELLAFVRADVNTHVNGADQSDDITMLTLKFN